VQATVATPQQLAALLNELSTHLNGAASPEMFRVLSELELSFTQMKALFLLRQHGELAVNALAGHLAMSLGAMSRAVDGLVRRGFVARRECAADRRSKLVDLLPPGRDALHRLSSARETALTAFAEELSEAERSALHAALLPIAERIASR
jgi:DNA-binding MarR family transcriptional regulator